MKPTKDTSRSVPPSDSLVPLESVLCTEELNQRPSRPPDYETENHALVVLVQALADSPRTILQTLADKILEVFRADSAGISLLTKEDGGKRFHWRAIAGMWKPHIGGGTPRDFGPCGDVLDRNAPLLFRHFERRYAYFLPVTPPVEECLLVPFHVEGKAVGTIWAIAHDERRKFDAEDRRQLESLGRFASAAYQAVEFLDALEQREEALRQSNSELAQHMAEVQKVGVQADDSRRAALDLMEDAVKSRQLAETLNAQLRSEITERKRAAETLRQRTAQYETLLNQAPLGVYLVDSNFRIRQVNPIALPVFGDIPDLIGRDFDDVTHILWTKQYADEVVRIFRHTLETGEPYETPERIEYRIDRGVTEYYEWQSNRIPLPDGYGVVCYFRDIATQVFARQAIAESEARYRGIVNQSVSGIAETDVTGRFTTVNDRYCDITGHSREELLTLRMQDITHAEDLSRHRALFERLTADGTALEIEKRYVRKDASSVWVHDSVSALRGPAGRVQSLIAVSIDITEWKRAETEREALLVREQAARAEAEAAVRARDVFLARASHELRTPLTSALGTVRLLGRAIQGRLKESPAELIEMANRNLNAVLTLIDNLLDASKLGARPEDLSLESVDLAAAVSDCLAVVAVQAREKGVALRTGVPAGLRPLADRPKVEQVLVNLLANAIKYTPPGGEVVIDGERNASHIVLRVRDTGDGIPQEYLDRIFEPFVRVGERRERGTGLGLAICRQIITLHGGRIWAESEGPGRGSTFLVHLPELPARPGAA